MKKRKILVVLLYRFTTAPVTVLDMVRALSEAITIPLLTLTQIAYCLSPYTSCLIRHLTTAKSSASSSRHDWASLTQTERKKQ